MTTAKKFGVLVVAIGAIALVAFLMDSSGPAKQPPSELSPLALESTIRPRLNNAVGAKSPSVAPSAPSPESAVAIARRDKPMEASETLHWPTSSVASRGSILKNAAGAPTFLSRSAAAQACKALGMRLATIRELVAWGGTILSDPEADANDLPPGHASSHINAIEADGSKDAFTSLYSAEKKTPPPEPNLEGHFVWSSSQNAGSPGEFYGLDVDHGYVSSGETDDPDPRYHLGAAYCTATR